MAVMPMMSLIILAQAMAITNNINSITQGNHPLMGIGVRDSLMAAIRPIITITRIIITDVRNIAITRRPVMETVKVVGMETIMTMTTTTKTGAIGVTAITSHNQGSVPGVGSNANKTHR